jgi:hypothetical protein
MGDGLRTVCVVAGSKRRQGRRVGAEEGDLDGGARQTGEASGAKSEQRGRDGGGQGKVAARAGPWTLRTLFPRARRVKSKRQIKRRISVEDQGINK